MSKAETKDDLIRAGVCPQCDRHLTAVAQVDAEWTYQYNFSTREWEVIEQDNTVSIYYVVCMSCRAVYDTAIVADAIEKVTPLDRRLM